MVEMDGYPIFDGLPIFEILPPKLEILPPTFEILPPPPILDILARFEILPNLIMLGLILDFPPGNCIPSI